MAALNPVTSRKASLTEGSRMTVCGFPPPGKLRIEGGASPPSSFPVKGWVSFGRKIHEQERDVNFPGQVYRLRQLAHEHTVDTALDVLDLTREDLKLFERDGNP